MRARLIASMCICTFTLASPSAFPAVPTGISIQGRLTDAAGNPLSAGTKTFAFRIWSAPVGGAHIWPLDGGGNAFDEVQMILSNTEGLWTAILGAEEPLTGSVFADSVRWLQITVDGTTLPRVRLVTGPYAFRVETLDGATGGAIVGALSVSGSVGIGMTTPQSKLHIVSGVSDDPPRVQSSGTTGFGAGLDFYHGTTGKGYVGVPDSSATIGPKELLLYGSPGTTTSLWAGGTRSVTIHTSGRVLIGGTGTAGNSRLAVTASSAEAAAVLASGPTGGGYGVIGSVTGPSATGVWGYNAAGWAGFFTGNVQVNGTLSKTAGAFIIDHPLDPANKYLSHSFVESPDMMNIYNGIVVTDAEGYTVVSMPNWFDALNRDFRYQLTVIGEFAQAIISKEIEDNRFSIRTDKPKVKVSWQVTGIRQDAYANAHRIPVEEAKPEKEHGFYRTPELFNQPEEKGIEWARHPEMMKQMKEEREKAKAESER